MKCFSLAKILGASAVASSLLFMPLTLSASAQNNTSPGTTLDENTTAPGERAAGEAADRDFDWGWLGLLGLAGLAGLLKRDSAEYRDPNSADTRSGIR